MRLNLPRACRPQSLQSLVSPASPPSARRTYAFQSPGGAVFKVFNSRAKWHQKERAAPNPDLSRQADYLKDEVAMRVCERLLVSLP
jgi:NADH dehydrogenase [ubiquinone] 1 alpha subcomplex assembly factor 5